MTLEEIQKNPERIRNLGVLALASLFHDAEDDEDEVTALKILAEVENYEHASPVFRDEYMRLWRERNSK